MSTLVLVEAVTSLGPLRDGVIDDKIRYQLMTRKKSWPRQKSHRNHPTACSEHLILIAVCPKNNADIITA